MSPAPVPPPVPAAVGVWLEGNADALAAAVVARVREQDRPPDAATLRNLRHGARYAVDCFLRRVAGRPAAGDELALFVAHGRAQQVAGRSFAELLGFYRLGGRAIWDHVGRTASPDAVGGAAVFALAGEVLAFVDDLSAAAAEGYTARAAEARRLERHHRERLHSLLLAGPGADGAADVVADAAAAAGWALPARVRVAVADLPSAPPAGSATPPAAVVSGTAEGGRASLVVAAGPEAERWLGRAGRALGLAAPLVIGPEVAWGEAGGAVGRALKLHDRLRAAQPTRHGDGRPDVVRYDDHEIALLLSIAPDVAASVVARRLAPLAGLPDPQRERLEATLGAWLADPGRPAAMAVALGLHVQTVRARLARLREAFGADLDDPDARFELALALRVRQG